VRRANISGTTTFDAATLDAAVTGTNSSDVKSAVTTSGRRYTSLDRRARLHLFSMVVISPSRKHQAKDPHLSVGVFL